MRTFVIAEAGISHGGNLETAYECILVAKESGADACKFQYFNAKKLAEARGKPALAEMLKPYEMPPDWLPKLKDACDGVGIEFMATTYYEEAIADVAPLVRRFKIGHAEANKKAFIDAHARYMKPIIISHSPSMTIAMHEGAVECEIRFLHCIDKYPTPIGEANLRGMAVAMYDGFSDHTRNVNMGGWAVAAGAKYVEVHFQPWNVQEHPDTCVSLTPSELWRYVQNIRQAELAVYGSSQG